MMYGRRPVIKLNPIITDTIWLCPAYRREAYKYKIRSVVIILAHRYIFRGLISTFSLE